MLPKARKNIDSISGGDANQVRRINAVMQIIDGSMIEDTKPAMALEHFKLALKDLEGVHQALPDHIAIRSRISHYALKSATIAESLDLFDDAAKLRSEAAGHLRSILKKNPELKLAKVDLAKIEILSAESDMRAGNDTQGAAKLKVAEALLADYQLTILAQMEPPCRLLQPWGCALYYCVIFAEQPMRQNYSTKPLT